MAITNPTITVNNTGPVSVEVVGMTYDYFLNMLGANVFRVMGAYILASSIRQLLQPIEYNIVDADGLKFTQVLNFNVDPNQKQAAIDVDLRDSFVLLNGQSDIDFDLLPNEWIQFTLISEQYDVSQGLDAVNKNNFSFLQEL